MKHEKMPHHTVRHFSISMFACNSEDGENVTFVWHIFAIYLIVIYIYGVCVV